MLNLKQSILSSCYSSHHCVFMPQKPYKFLLEYFFRNNFSKNMCILIHNPVLSLICEECDFIFNKKKC